MDKVKVKEKDTMQFEKWKKRKNIQKKKQKKRKMRQEMRGILRVTHLPKQVGMNSSDKRVGGKERRKWEMVKNERKKQLHLQRELRQLAKNRKKSSR